MRLNHLTMTDHRNIKYAEADTRPSPYGFGVAPTARARPTCWRPSGC